MDSICPFRSISTVYNYYFVFFLQRNKMQGAALLVIAGLVVMASAYGIRPDKSDGEEYTINNCSLRIYHIRGRPIAI